MKYRIPITLFIGVVLATTVHAFQVTQYSLKKGDTYTIESNINQSISQLVMGQSQDINSKVHTIEELKVLDVDNDIFTIQMTTLVQKSETVTPYGTTKIDSDDPTSANGMGGVLKDHPYTFTMDKEGTILEIFDLEAIKQSLSEALQDNPMVLNSVLGIFDDDNVRANLENRFTIYPESNNTTWTIEKDITNNGMPVKTTTVYTREGNNIINSESTISVDATTTNMGTPVDLKMSGTQSGVITLDTNSGMPLSATGSSNVSGNASAQGMEIPMTITTEVSTTITKN